MLDIQHMMCDKYALFKECYLKDGHRPGHIFVQYPPEGSFSNWTNHGPMPGTLRNFPFLPIVSTDEEPGYSPVPFPTFLPCELFHGAKEDDIIPISDHLSLQLSNLSTKHKGYGPFEKVLEPMLR
jgi:hypothetical protein